MLTQDKKLLLIGQVTALSGVPIRTIRYYESLGLIQSLGRTEGGFRQFSSDVLTRLYFIKRAQSLGLSLQEIGEILQVYDGGKPACDDIQQKLKDKISEIDRQIEQLLTLRHELRGLLSGWDSLATKPEDTICPIIQKD
ncbi:MerR family transcriptional regulator [Scytonema sp. HK-05]|uniref:heavy metal-responsive transcriptional regulator n=1 Tax=Scytonema sp. HK-05 TaxID=1137095 RepID=UPI000937B762|nr:heavy metal-responsive transcriptional regulator [Scytonema sp. HK-05]OKH42767.1 heavy metal-responsive transcriptional regulator [Scytonema sp. HK-05]BAY44408.1 MerR family transcriptional regulator [Scytonema sp. HK-05]